MIRNFCDQLASDLGLEEAIFLTRFGQWIDANMDHEENVFDGHVWSWTTGTALQAQFPYWSQSTIRRLLKRLVDAKILHVQTGGFPERRHNKTWLRFIDEDEWFPRLGIGRRKRVAAQKRQNEQTGVVQNDEPNENKMMRMVDGRNMPEVTDVTGFVTLTNPVHHFDQPPLSRDLGNDLGDFKTIVGTASQPTTDGSDQTDSLFDDQPEPGAGTVIEGKQESLSSKATGKGSGKPGKPPKPPKTDPSEGVKLWDVWRAMYAEVYGRDPERGPVVNTTLARIAKAHPDDAIGILVAFLKDRSPGNVKTRHAVGLLSTRDVTGYASDVQGIPKLAVAPLPSQYAAPPQGRARNSPLAPPVVSQADEDAKMRRLMGEDTVTVSS